MIRREDLLNNLRVASPCDASWDEMRGSDKVRHCNQCRLNVYNLSAMSRGEAEQTIIEHEGRLCVRYFQREDGTVLTKDCPVGFAAVRRRFLQICASAAACALAGLCLRGLTEGYSETTGRLASNSDGFRSPQGDASIGSSVAETEPSTGTMPNGYTDPRPIGGALAPMPPRKNSHKR